MSFENRHIFRGRINNISLGDLKIKTDCCKIEGLEERKKIVENILKEKGMFFDEYFDNHYKVELSQNDELSENNNVCKVLESYANYLLGSKEVREERKKSDFIYRFYIDKTEFKERTKIEESLEGKIHTAGLKGGVERISENNERVIDFLLKTTSNNKLSKQQRVFEKDIQEDSYCGKVLRDYQSALDEIDYRLKDIKICKKEDRESKDSGQRYILTKAKKDIHYDMIQCKTQLKGSFGDRLRNQIKESTEPSWDCFDWHNPQHIKELLLLQYDYETQDDLSYMVMDLEDIITELKEVYYNGEGEKKSFSKKEKEVIDLIRKGYSESEIKKIINVSQQRVNELVWNMSGKILEYTLDNFKRDI